MFFMHHAVRDHLRLIITIALTLVKRQSRRDYCERITSKSDPAVQAIASRIADAVLRHFDVERRPDPEVGPPLGSRNRACPDKCVSDGDAQYQCEPPGHADGGQSR